MNWQPCDLKNIEARVRAFGGKLWRRLYFALNRRRLERELADEMAAHRDTIPENQRTAFGNVVRLREEAREVWS